MARETKSSSSQGGSERPSGEASALSRQVKRRAALLAAKREGRPGPHKPVFTPDTLKPERLNRHHLWTVMRGRTEVYMHATKGLRIRYIGEA